MNLAICAAAARIALKGAKAGQRVAVAANERGECEAHELFTGSLQRKKEEHPGAKLFTAMIDDAGRICLSELSVTERGRSIAAFL